MRPQTLLSRSGVQLVPANTSKGQATSVNNDNTGTTVGAVNGLQDVTVSSRVTSSGATCKLPIVYKCAEPSL